MERALIHDTMKSSMRVAFICSHTEDDYQSAVLGGAFLAARAAGIEFCAIQLGVLLPEEGAAMPSLNAAAMVRAIGADAVVIMDFAIRHH